MLQKIISLISLLLFVNQSYAMEFLTTKELQQRGIEIELNTPEDIYPLHPTSISLKVSFNKTDNLTFTIVELPNKNSFSKQLETRTIYTDTETKRELIQDFYYYFKRSGFNEVPAIPVRIQGTLDTKTVDIMTSTKASRIKVNRLESEFNFVARDVTVDVEIFKGQETVDLDDEEPIIIKKGESLKYILSFNAQDASALFIPKILFQDIEDVKIYTKVIDNNEVSNRGEIVVTKRLEVTAIYNRAGLLEHKLVPITYYNLTDEVTKKVEIPSFKVKLKGLYMTSSQKKIALIIILVLLVITGAVYYFKDRLMRVINEIKRRRMRHKDLQIYIKDKDHLSILKTLFTQHRETIREQGLKGLKDYYYNTGFEKYEEFNKYQEEVFKRTNSDLEVDKVFINELFLWQNKEVVSLQKQEVSISLLNRPRL